MTKNSVKALGAVVLGAAILMAGRAAFARKREGGPGYFKYRVKPGDTLSALALKFFGDASQVSALRSSRKDVLLEGETLEVPCVWISVLPGDTLSKIAARHLGDAARWRRITALNKLPGDKVDAGQWIAVPVAPAPAGASAPALAPPAPVPPALKADAVEVGCGLDFLGVC